jgi:hypothetical protein
MRMERQYLRSRKRSDMVNVDGIVADFMIFLAHGKALVVQARSL